MMRSLLMLALPGASAIHLGGPMNDAMVACRAANCPDFTLMSPDANVAGTGLPLTMFLAPPMNANPFIYDMEYALNVFGFTDNGARTPGEFSYRAAAGTPQNLTATSTEDQSAGFACMCEKCGAMVEAIFQPVGRWACAAVGFDLPCQSEFDACQAATTRPDGYTGSAAGMDIAYPPILPPKDAAGNWIPSSDVCQPEATFGAYKAAYDLETQCAAGDTDIGGSTEALTLAKCVAASRADVYLTRGVSPAASDIGGFTCGLAYGEVPTFACTFADAALYDFTANTIADTASDTCKTCVATNSDISPCIGAPECVAHQFTPSMYLDHMGGGGAVINMICTGLRTSLCDELSMNVINEKKEFFSGNANCPAPPPPPSFPCSFDNDDVTAWQAGSPYTNATAECTTCLTTNEAVANKQSTCWGPPECVRPAFQGLVLSMPPSQDVIRTICYTIGNAAWGQDSSSCSAQDNAVIDSKKLFFQCPTGGPPGPFPCTFDEDVPFYALAKAGEGSMMAIPNLACYRCIAGNNNNIAPCIGPPACVAETFTPEIMGGGMPGIIDTICTGLCTDSCSATDIMVIEEKQALMGGGCTTRGTPVASTCPPPPEPAAEPAAEPGPESTASEPEPEPAASSTTSEATPAATTPAATTPAPASSATSLVYASSLLALCVAKTVL